MVVAFEKQTYWEAVAETRWGAYITRYERRELLAAATSLRRPGTALEVGCEGGRWSRLLADLGWRLVCTDVDATTLALCAERIPEATCVLVDSADTRLPCDDAAVQLLLAYEVDPVTSASWFPSEAARVLAAGGILVCTFLNRRSVRGAAYLALHRLGRRRHDYYVGPTYGAYRRALRDTGLEPVRQLGLGWAPFTRNSDASLIPLATALEQVLGLRRLPALSPLVVVTARRR
jgi:SAM-dependent methyltransferase